jgi:DNA-binding protein H-NS
LTTSSTQATIISSGLSVPDYTFQKIANIWSTDMTVNAQSRAEAFDISPFFAPEIINPTKQLQTAMVFSADPHGTLGDFKYRLSKHLDHPVQCHFERPSLSEELPRGIPWHNFPVVSDPFYRISLGSLGTYSPSDFSVVGKNPTSESLLETSDVIVFRNNAGKWGCAARAYEMAYVLQKFGQADRLILIDNDDERFVPTTIADLKAPMSAELRFRYSYLVNFKAIAMKAVRAVGADVGRDDWDIEPYKTTRFCDAKGITPMVSAPITHPLALQWLYRLRSLGTFDVSYASACEEFTTRLVGELGEYELVESSAQPIAMELDLVRAAALLRHKDDRHTLVFDEDYTNDLKLSQLRNVLRRKGITFTSIGTSRRVVKQLIDQWDGDSSRFFALDNAEPATWKGTGKHPALAIDRNVAASPLAFIGMKLVDYDAKAKTITLSDKGHRFLDLLHPDCEDPDVLLRWMGPDGLFKQGVGKSCDDWIMRFFSKMKTRINEIEA